MEGWIAGALLCAPFVGLLCVIAAELVPDERIANQLLDAEESGVVAPADDRPTPLGTRFPYFSECSALSIGLGDLPGDGAVVSAIRSPVYAGGCRGLRSALERFESTDSLPAGTPYFRYWHGYTVITRPALALVGADGLRWLTFALLALGVGVMCAAVSRAFGGLAGVILAAPVLLTTDVVIGALSALMAIAMAIAWFGAWTSFRLVARRPAWRTAGLAAALAGAGIAFFDGMITTPGSFALVVVAATLGAFAAPQHAIGVRDAWRVTGAAAVGWWVGLAWMWAWKWVAAAAVFGIGTVVEDIASQIGFRTSTDSRGVSDARTAALTMNFRQWWDQPWTPWVVAALVVILVVTFARRAPSKAAILGTTSCCAIVAGFVILWYPVLNNHSQIHVGNAHKSLPLAFGAVAALMYVCIDLWRELDRQPAPTGPARPADAATSSHSKHAESGS